MTHFYRNKAFERIMQGDGDPTKRRETRKYYVYPSREALGTYLSKGEPLSAVVCANQAGIETIFVVVRGAGAWPIRIDQSEGSACGAEYFSTTISEGPPVITWDQWTTNYGSMKLMRFCLMLPRLNHDVEATACKLPGGRVIPFSYYIICSDWTELATHPTIPGHTEFRIPNLDGLVLT